MTAGFREPPAGFQAPLDKVSFDPFYESQFPRFVVKIEGNTYLGESYEYTENAHGATDQATITLPIDGWANFKGVLSGGLSSVYPDWSVSIARSVEAGNASTPVIAEIWAGFPPDPTLFGPKNLSGLQLRFRGIVDQYSALLQENKTTFSCRSLAFPLASTKITVPFPDEPSVTTVAFIQQMCKQFNIPMAPPNLGVPPVKMIDVLGGAYITGVRAKYIWDIMLLCALFDDVDIWVDNTGTLHYEAASLVVRPKLYYQWGKNCEGLEGTHSPQFSKNVRVYVHSFVPRTRTTSTTRVTTSPDGGGITQESYSRVVNSTPIFGTTSSVTTTYNGNGTVSTSLSESGGGGATGGTGELNESGIEKYYYFPKNKTLAQCEVIAQQRWRQISMHEYSIKIEAPVTKGNLSVMGVDATVVLSGHPMSLFNSIVSGGSPGNPPILSGGYWPRQIIESFDPRSGWHWTIDAVNHPLPQGAV